MARQRKKCYQLTVSQSSWSNHRKQSCDKKNLECKLREGKVEEINKVVFILLFYFYMQVLRLREEQIDRGHRINRQNVAKEKERDDKKWVYRSTRGGLAAEGSWERPQRVRLDGTISSPFACRSKFGI